MCVCVCVCVGLICIAQETLGSMMKKAFWQLLKEVSVENYQRISGEWVSLTNSMPSIMVRWKLVLLFIWFVCVCVSCGVRVCV